MKIFISWSGERSKNVAFALKEWLPDVFQGDEIFMSAHDIEAGARWGNRLNAELESSSFGIVCLTPENLSAPWLLFEAGALSKAIEESHVVPYLLELKPTDVKGPLGQFQGVVSDENGTLKLIQSINAVREKPLSAEHLQKLFSKWWTDLQSHLNNIQPVQNNQIVSRTELDLLEEVLQLLRSNIKNEQGKLFSDRPRFISELRHRIIFLHLHPQKSTEDILLVLNDLIDKRPIYPQEITKQKDNQIRLRVAFQDTIDFDDFVSKLKQFGWGVMVAPDFPLE